MLTVQNLNCTLGQTKILHDLNFSVPAAGVTVLLGPSGSGKTSLLRCLAGLEKYQGQVQLDQQTLDNIPTERRNLAYIEQTSTLFPHLNVAENIAYPLRLRHQPRAEIRTAVADLTDRLNLTALLQRQPHQLSGGEQRRVMVARSLIYRPSMLLCDEPWAGVDALQRYDLVQWIKTVFTDLIVPIIYVTHDLAEAAYLSQRRLVLRAGRLVAESDPWLKDFLDKRF